MWGSNLIPLLPPTLPLALQLTEFNYNESRKKRKSGIKGLAFLPLSGCRKPFNFSVPKTPNVINGGHKFLTNLCLRIKIVIYECTLKYSWVESMVILCMFILLYPISKEFLNWPLPKELYSEKIKSQKEVNE